MLKRKSIFFIIAISVSLFNIFISSHIYGKPNIIGGENPFSVEECAQKNDDDKRNSGRILSCFSNTKELVEWMNNQGKDFISYCLCSFNTSVIPDGENSCNRLHYPGYQLVQIEGIHSEECHKLGGYIPFELVDANPEKGIPANHIPVAIASVRSSGVGEVGSEVFSEGRLIGATNSIQYRGACMKYTDNFDSNNNERGSKCKLTSTDKEFSIKFP